MADSWKPDYIDLDSGAWLASRTRRKLKDPRMWGIYWELIHLLNEAGGSMELDREDLLDMTLATPEELDRVLALDHFDQTDGVLTHRVVTAKIDRIRERLGKSSEGGKRSGEVRRAKAAARRQTESGTPFEPPSEPVPKGGGSKGLKDLRTEGLTEGLTRAREGSESPPAAMPRNPPGQVKPGSHREPEKPGSTPAGQPAPTRPTSSAEGGPLNAERIQLLLDGCRNPNDRERDQIRPWVTRAFGRWFSRQTMADQLVVDRAFCVRFGFGFDTGPPAAGSPVAAANGSATHARAPAGAPARVEALPAARDMGGERGEG